MEMIPVSSEAVSAIGYDGQNLHITYRGGGKTYVLLDVPRHVADGLMKAESKGQYIAKHIWTQHPGQAIR